MLLFVLKHITVELHVSVLSKSFPLITGEVYIPKFDDTKKHLEHCKDTELFLLKDTTIPFP